MMLIEWIIGKMTLKILYIIYIEFLRANPHIAMREHIYLQRLYRFQQHPLPQIKFFIRGNPWFKDQWPFNIFLYYLWLYSSIISKYFWAIISEIYACSSWCWARFNDPYITFTEDCPLLFVFILEVDVLFYHAFDGDFWWGGEVLFLEAWIVKDLHDYYRFM